MNAYAAFQLTFMSLPFERMKQYISAPFSREYPEAFAVENDPIRLLIKSVKNSNLGNLERVKATYIYCPFYLPNARCQVEDENFMAAKGELLQSLSFSLALQENDIAFFQ